MKSHEKIIIDKMKKYANQIIDFTSGLNFEALCNDLKTLHASVFGLSQIGELVKKLDKEFIDKHNHIPWVKIKHLRNHIVHDYEGIQLKMLWTILTKFVPEFIADLSNLK